MNAKHPYNNRSNQSTLPSQHTAKQHQQTVKLTPLQFAFMEAFAGSEWNAFNCNRNALAEKGEACHTSTWLFVDCIQDDMRRICRVDVTQSQIKGVIASLINAGALCCNVAASRIITDEGVREDTEAQMTKAGFDAWKAQRARQQS